MNDLSGIEHAYLPMAVGAEKCARASYRHAGALAAESPARSVSRTCSVFKSWMFVLDGYEDAQKVHPSSTSFIGVCVQEERKDDGAHKRDRSLWWWLVSALRDGCISEDLSLQLFERWLQIIFFTWDLTQHVIKKRLCRLLSNVSYLCICFCCHVGNHEITMFKLTMRIKKIYHIFPYLKVNL